MAGLLYIDRGTKEANMTFMLGRAPGQGPDQSHSQSRSIRVTRTAGRGSGRSGDDLLRSASEGMGGWE
jgi:hypothetical protein